MNAMVLAAEEAKSPLFPDSWEMLITGIGSPVVYLDSGNALFGSQSIAPEAVPQQERKAQALAHAPHHAGKWPLAPPGVCVRQYRLKEFPP